jgi:hypothetical protein
LYEQICPNPQPYKPAKDKKHNREKKVGMKGKKNPPLWHLTTSHKTCNFRFTESKGRGEKSKQKIKGETCREQRERE